MSEAKIQIKIGSIEFSGEGNQKWVESQLDKILSKAGDLLKLAPSSDGKGHKPIDVDPSIGNKALGTYLKEKSATTNQIKKFLATAVWLESKGKNRLKTNDVTKALRDSNQKKLTNATQCLNNNLEKGFCEKDGSEFYVTDEGKSSL